MSIRPRVIEAISSTLSNRFNVVDNTAGADKKIIAGQFPDVLIFKKGSTANKELLFIMKVENGGELIDSLPTWKELSAAPSTFYIVVPQGKLDDARKLAGHTGVVARFASYKEENGAIKIDYE